AAKMAIMAITTKSSIKVKPFLFFIIVVSPPFVFMQCADSRLLPCGNESVLKPFYLKVYGLSRRNVSPSPRLSPRGGELR
ncbi:MAG: hypothetical protein ABII89_06355, partial [Candidatus Omnitrophota bacterium]